MSEFFRRLVSRRRLDRVASPRRRHASAPELAPLERRELMTILINLFTTKIYPQVLTPSNGKYVPIHLQGTVATSLTTAVPSLSFVVTDQWRQDEPTAAIALHPIGPGIYSYDTQFYLQALTRGTFAQSRHYYVLVIAKDADGPLSRTLPIVVLAHPTGPTPPAVKAARR
jgi:hypothetical protein